MRFLSVLIVVATVMVPAAQAQDSTATPRRSWTSDRPRLDVGDIVTVLIDERTVASAILRDTDADRRSRQMDARLSTPGGGGTAAGVTSGQDTDSRRTGENVRQNNFRSEVSARVVAISPTGMLQVRGQKEVQVDKSRQLVTITGWVRPNDIAASTNTVESWRLADAQIAYAQSGALGKPKSGILTRVIGIIWP